MLKTPFTILLLALLVITLPAAAEQHTSKSNQTTAEGDPETTEEEDIGDDAGLITDEFSYMYLFDQHYGIIAGFGKSSPSYLMHLEGLMFLHERISISMLIGYGIEQKFNSDEHKHTADTLSLTVKSRYYLPLLPLSINGSCGYVFWDGKIGANDSRSKLNYKSYETYLGVSLSAYYFWKTGIYLESVIYGFGIGKAFGLKGEADRYEDIITETIEDSEHYGIFGGGLLNLAVGYMF